MTYSAEESVPDAWLVLADSFVACVSNAEETQGMPSVTDIYARERRGRLHLDYSGGDFRADAYAEFAKDLSGRICYTCGDLADRLVFTYPKCANCA